jgi:gamma-glutamyl:cysteine ligase YbdK (ATP-grasp superfamily)
MEKAFHVQRVAAKINAVERSLDDTLAQAAELLVEMKTAQQGLELGSVITDSAFAKLTEAMSELAQARSAVVATHKRLVKIYDVADLRAVAAGTIPITLGAEVEVEDVAPLRIAG